MNESVKRRCSRRMALIIAGAVLGLSAIALLLLPVGIENGLEQWFMDNGFSQADIGDIDFNPFTGTLTIKSLDAVGPNDGEIRLKIMQLSFRWIPLLRKRMHIARLSLRNGSMDLSRQPTGWVIGGLLLASEPDTHIEQKANTWQWGLDQLVLRNIAIRFRGYDMKETITISETNVKSLYSWSADKPASFQTVLGFDKGRIGVDGSIRQSSKDVNMTATLNIKDLALDGLAPLVQKAGVSSFTAALEGTMNLEGTLEPSTGKGSVNAKGKVTLKEIGAELPLSNHRVSIHQDEFSFQGAGSVRIEKKELLTVTGSAEIATKGLGIKQAKDDRAIIDIERADVKDISFDIDKGITVGNCRFREIRLFERNRSSNEKIEVPSRIVTIGTLSAKNVIILKDRVDTEGINIINLQAWITRHIDKTIDVVEWANHIKNLTESEEKQKQPREHYLRIGSLTVSEDSELAYSDHTVSPSFMAYLSAVALNAGAIDTEHPHAETPIEFSAILDKYSNLSIKGSIRPLQTNLTTQLKGKITSLDLPTLNPYLKNTSPYRVKSGHLDADVDWDVKEGVLNSNAAIMITKLDLERIGKEEDEGVLGSLMGMPLNKAVSILRDRHGDIRLTIPINGDIRNPEFSLRNVIAKATANALKEGMLSYYAPFGVTLLTGAVLPPGSLWLANQLIHFATQLRFDPVEFMPLDATLTPDAEQYLDKIISRLADKSEIDIVLCGVAGTSDIETLRAEAGIAKKKPLKDDSAPGEKESVRLKDLAGQRAETVMGYLIDHGIASERIHLCEPGIDTEADAQPRVEIAI